MSRPSISNVRRLNTPWNCDKYWEVSLYKGWEFFCVFQNNSSRFHAQSLLPLSGDRICDLRPAFTKLALVQGEGSLALSLILHVAQ